MPVIYDIGDIINFIQLQVDFIADCYPIEIVCKCKAITETLIRDSIISVTGHTIPAYLIESAFEKSKEFFYHTEEFKESCISRDKARRGYSKNKSENFAALIDERNKPNDLVEKYRIGPVDAPMIISAQDVGYYQTKEGRVFFYENIWPDSIENFKNVMSLYYNSVKVFSFHLLQILEIGLQMPRGFFSSIMDKQTSILSVNYYPHISKEFLESSSDFNLRKVDDDNFVRVSKHTDVSMLTIISQKSYSLIQNSSASITSESLQYINTKDDWVNVPNLEIDNLVIHVGDLLQDWSRNIFKSTMHRVLSNHQAVNERFSMAYFLSPNYDSQLNTFYDCNKMKCDCQSDEIQLSTCTCSSRVFTYAKWRQQKIKQTMKSLKS